MEGKEEQEEEEEKHTFSANSTVAIGDRERERENRHPVFISMKGVGNEVETIIVNDDDDKERGIDFC
jgi:hypothetical protein